MSGKSPTPYNAIYSATKYALNGFVASLALELEGSGVHVGTVCPSFVADAGMWADSGVQAPTLMKEVPLNQVLKAVKAVLSGSTTEVLVTHLQSSAFGALRTLSSIGAMALEKARVWAALERRQVVAIHCMEGRIAIVCVLRPGKKWKAQQCDIVP